MINHSRESASNIVKAGGEMIVIQRPSEPAYPLRFYEFLILREANEYHAIREKRNIAISILVSCFIGAISAYMGTDWAKGIFSVQAALFLLLANASVISSVLMFFFHSESRKRVEGSAYMELTERISRDLGPQTKPKD